jgi:glycosyltransferase involved in cell wall biosynthesis
MKVLLSNKFFFLNGGSERVFFQERDFLINNNIDVIDFSMDDPRNYFSPWFSYFVSNVDYNNPNGNIWNKVSQSTKFVHSREAVRKVQNLIKQEKPDIAHLHNIYHQLTPSIIPILNKHGIKIIMTLHDGKLICPSYLMLNNGAICTSCNGKHFWQPVSKNCQGSSLKGALLMLEAYWHKWRRSYSFVDLFIAPSKFIADMVSKRIPTEKIHVLRNGIDTNEYTPTFHDDGYCLYFGRLSREKGIETLVKAHETLDYVLPLNVVGRGPLFKRLSNTYPNVNFLGYKEGDELKDIIARSAFVLVPSEWYENCSMVILEAMAMGKPVIGSRIGGIPEQIVDGKTGFLFEMGNMKELGDKMSILSKDKELRAKMGAEARRKLEQDYSLDGHFYQLMEVYKKVLSTT